MRLIGTDIRPRCRVCGKLLAEAVTRPWTIGCGRCKTSNSSTDGTIPRETRVAPDTPDT